MARLGVLAGHRPSWPRPIGGPPPIGRVSFWSRRDDGRFYRRNRAAGPLRVRCSSWRPDGRRGGTGESVWPVSRGRVWFGEASADLAGPALSAGRITIDLRLIATSASTATPLNNAAKIITTWRSIPASRKSATQTIPTSAVPTANSQMPIIAANPAAKIRLRSGTSRGMGRRP
jgi:hypothetical protein